MRFTISDDAHFSFNSLSGRSRGDITPILIEVSVEKIFNAWKATDSGRYFFKADSGDAKIFKIDRATAWITDFDEVWAPIVDSRSEDPAHITFADGRHTFTALKNFGYKRISVVVPTVKAEILSKTFGALD